MTTDAVVVGAGPNGLVAANLLADAGWSVVVLERDAQPGGGVRSYDGPAPGFVGDTCSAFYPLAAASPVIRRLRLEDHGLRWTQAPSVLAHPLPDGRCAVLHREVEDTVVALDGIDPGDGAVWRRLCSEWSAISEPLLGALLTPFPPVRAGARLARTLGVSGSLRLARQLLSPVGRMARDEFAGVAAPLLLAGCALHTDLAPESAGSTVFGWLLAMTGQQVGFPVPVGGAGALTSALVRRLESCGGRVECNADVREIVVRRNRAVAVRTTDGNVMPARRAVVADVVAPDLYGGLVAWEHLPTGLRRGMDRFAWDHAAVKVDWALDGPVPWSAPEAGAAGTVHVAADLDEMSRYAAQLAAGEDPDRPFLIVGQMTTADPSRSPVGTESMWAYTHVPRRVDRTAHDAQRCADRVEGQLERFAPGFRDRVVARTVGTRPTINGGTAALQQQLMFRPTPGLGRAETPIVGLYLASASAHPGGGVHGACGGNAARAALRAHRSHLQAAGAWATRKVMR